MTIRKTCLLVLLCAAAAPAGRNAPPETPRLDRWEETIRQFETWDAKNSFPSQAVLFVGSSSIRMWATRNSFPDLPVINRGFGGSQISDVNTYLGRIVLPYKPAAIVFYAGDNDIAAAKTPARVLADYRIFTRLVHEKLPKTPIIFITIKPSLSRWALWPAMSDANRMIEDFSKNDSRLHFVDAATCLLGPDGRPAADLFLPDNLHLSKKGYKLWTGILTPVIREALKQPPPERRTRPTDFEPA